MSESPGTTITSGSVVSSAIGVTSSRVTAESLKAIAPTITSPITISWLGWPWRLRKLERPIVPPAPPTL